MFGWKCLAVLAIVAGLFLLVGSWISWWLCKDVQCALLFLGAFILGCVGGKLWEETQEMCEKMS